MDFPQIFSLLLVINPKLNDIINDLPFECLKGEPYLTETMASPRPGFDDLKFRIGPVSFFQTNVYQAERLYKAAFDLADVQGDELMYDLYTGTGTIAQYFSRFVKKVVGIEYVEAAINDAKINAEINGITNCTFYAGDMAKVFTDDFIETMASPRSGYNDLTFRIGPVSFFQTNVYQAERLYRTAFDLANVQGDELMYDLYTGTGTIAQYFSRFVKKVVGIEYVEAAIEDAKVNAEINGITNCTFYAGDMAKVFTDDFIATNGSPDLIVTDPPRAGMAEKVVEQLLKIRAKKIVYVSCNPATQARDLQLLDSAYKVMAVQPVDMFPHTQHVENVCLLQLR